MKRFIKHLILVPLYATPVLLTYVAGTFLAVGDALRAAPLLIIAAVALVGAYFRGLYLEERNEEFDDLRVTPVWGKRIPRWAQDTLPETKAPPLRTVKAEPFDEPSRTRLRRVEWPDGGHDSVPSSPAISADMQAEITKTEPKAS